MKVEIARSETQVAAGAAGVAASVLPPVGAPLAAAPAGVAVPIMRAPEVVVSAGSGAVGVPPGLISFAFTAGGVNVNFFGSTWAPMGHLRYRCEDLTVGGYVYSEVSALDVYQLNMSITGGMVVGHAYRLAYSLDLEPDVAGWDDGLYRDLGISWTQPSRTAPPVSGDYSRGE